MGPAARSRFRFRFDRPSHGYLDVKSLHPLGRASVRTERVLVARRIVAAIVLSVASATAGCDYVDTPYTYAVLDNDYSTSATPPLVVYRAYWQAVSFQSPTAPGSSSAPQPTVPCSDNTAWAVLAPGWDPTSSTPPTSFIVLQSRSGFAVDLGDTVHIPVDDATFAGSCEAGSPLSQSQADFITQLVFPGVFADAGLRYDAATCTTSPVDDADAGAR